MGIDGLWDEMPSKNMDRNKKIPPHRIKRQGGFAFGGLRQGKISVQTATRQRFYAGCVKEVFRRGLRQSISHWEIATR